MSEATYKRRFGPDYPPEPVEFLGLCKVRGSNGKAVVRASIRYTDGRDLPADIVIPDRVMVKGTDGIWACADPDYDCGSVIAEPVVEGAVRTCRGCGGDLVPSGKRGRPAVWHEGCKPGSSPE